MKEKYIEFLPALNISVLTMNTLNERKNIFTNISKLGQSSSNETCVQSIFISVEKKSKIRKQIDTFEDVAIQIYLWALNTFHIRATVKRFRFHFNK